MKKPRRTSGEMARTCRTRMVPTEGLLSVFCKHKVELGPEKYGSVIDIGFWLKQGGYLGVWTVHHQRGRGQKPDFWGVKFANADTAFAVRMRWS